MVWDDLAHGGREALDGLGAWGTSGEIRQDGLGGLAVALLQVAEGFLGRCCLLLVTALLVPLGGGAGQVQGGEDHGDGEAAGNVGGVGEFLGGLAQPVGGLVVGPDRRAACLVERLGRCLQFGLVRAGCGAGQVVQGVAKGFQVSLGNGVVVRIENRAGRAQREGRKPVELPHMVTHDLRHFFASALIAGGASVKQVQLVLGHASAVITLRTYAHLWPGEEDRTRSVMDAVLGGMRTGCGQVGDVTREIAGQRA